MSDEKEIIAATEKLLAAASSGDVATYATLSAESLTAIEPETQGTVITGLPFHKHMLNLGKGQPPGPPVLNSLGSPHVRMLGKDYALICYTRVNQNGAKISAAQETRVWQREGGQWKNIHFHRSPLARL